MHAPSVHEKKGKMLSRRTPSVQALLNAQSAYAQRASAPERPVMRAPERQQ